MSLIINPYRYQFLPLAGAPEALDDAGVLLDASAITGVSDGATLSQWDDQSTNGWHATAAGGVEPTYIAEAINGQPAVRFDGTNDVMTADSAAALFSGSSIDSTLIVVLRYRAATTDRFAVSVGNSADNNPTIGLSSGSATAHHRVFGKNNAATSTNYIDDAPSTSTGLAVIDRDGTGATVMGMKFNGTLRTEWASSSEMTVNRFSLGALRRSAVSNYANVDIAYVVAWNRLLTASELGSVERYLLNRYAPNVGWDATQVLGINPPAYAGTDAIVELADITNATELREQDDIVHDPNDPNLGANPEREYKFYFSATVSGSKRVYVCFSADGATFGAPQVCTMGGSDRVSEDPSVCQLIATPGQVYRDGSDKMYLYVEDSTTDTIYVYESTDGITFTEMASNPVIPKGGGGAWDVNLVGSPGARHDGTNFQVIYEGIGSSVEATGLAAGVSANSLTKSANNPVWTAATDPVIPGNSLVVDSWFKLGSTFVFVGHSGLSTSGVTVFYGVTSNLDPSTWVDGDIDAIRTEKLTGVRNDFTIDHTVTDGQGVITGPEADDRLTRHRIWGEV